MSGGSAPWLVLAAGAHLGFQLTVTLVVYPALADVSPDQWSRAHDAHSRRITPAVVLVYAGLLVAVLASLWSEPAVPANLAAAAGAGVCMALTAAAAAPLHSRLGHGHDALLVRRLLLVDRLRLLGALGCVVAAVLAA
ncbi:MULTISPECIES: hypothetical protein [unclassified Knoellia]|uniref:hypothetical protein n=1 Tax=Knoellia altitudinis TaxID=3404795 RepID=UPI003616280F